MKPIVIEVNRFRKKIHEIISRYPLNELIDLENISYEDRNIYIIKSKNEKNIDEISIRNWIVFFIQHIIIEAYGESLANKKVVKLLKAIDKTERTEIIKNVMILLNDYDHCIKEKEAIGIDILDSILENDLFNIDGYLRFRSYNINFLIDKSIEIVVEDLDIESEYNEFINMLQFYFETQIPLIDMVNVIIDKDNFKLLDSDNNIIESRDVDQIIEDIYFDDINKTDILVSSLIVLAPRKIVLHIVNDKEKDLIMVLRKIFSDRLSLCYGCNICEFNMIKNKDGE